MANSRAFWILLTCSLAGCDFTATGSSNPDLPPVIRVDGNEGRVWWPIPGSPPSHYDVQGEFRAATAWLNAVYDERKGVRSWVEVDYLKLYARINGVDSLVASDEYGDGLVGGRVYGGWFASEWEYIKDSGATFINESVILPVDSCTQCVWHLWVIDYPRRLLPPSASKVWVEARFRIVGAAVVQLGWDYNRNETDTTCDINQDGRIDPGYCEAGKSRWAFPASANNGWQVLSLGR
jgi:hypothetical protein